MEVAQLEGTPRRKR